MIKRNQRLLNNLSQLMDAMIVVASYALACYFWLDLFRGDTGNMAAWSNGRIPLLACLYAVCVLVVLLLMGFYNSDRRMRLKRKIRILFFAVSLALLGASTLLFIFDLQEFSRGVLLLFYVFSLGLLSCKYILMRYVLRFMRKKGYNIKHIVVIGTGHLARQFVEDIRSDTSLGYRIDGFVGKRAEDAEPYLGDFSALDSLLHGNRVDEAVIAMDLDEYREVEPLIHTCERNGTKYYVVPYYNDLIPPHPEIEVVGRTNLIRMRAIALENYSLAVLKRTFDIVASGLGIVLISPILLLLALGVKLSSPGPVFFRQERVGFQKKNFMMYKFRSLRMEKEEKDGWSSIDRDRKTPFGSFIRKFSLDELPQLFNVLKGDMSLVGPRPELPKFVDQFRETVPFYMVKHQVRPGMTGWAQVNGYRGDTSIERRVELDIWYIENWTPSLDIKILFRTVFGGLVNKEQLYKKDTQDKNPSA